VPKRSTFFFHIASTHLRLNFDVSGGAHGSYALVEKDQD
jgi:hypothetical protein